MAWASITHFPEGDAVSSRGPGSPPTPGGTGPLSTPGALQPAARGSGAGEGEGGSAETSPRPPAGGWEEALCQDAAGPGAGGRVADAVRGVPRSRAAEVSPQPREEPAAAT